jgi:hypothetical protein
LPSSDKFQGAKIIKFFLFYLSLSPSPKREGLITLRKAIIAPLLSWEKGLGDEVF